MDIKIKNYYNNVEILTPNQTEAENLSKVTIDSLENAFLAGEKILSLGPNFVIITLSEQGSVLISNQEKIHFEGHRVNVVNSVGAGDCFNGALAVGIKKGLSLNESIKLGNKSASISVSRKCVQESMPFFNEIKTIEL
jgi:ribokinase